MALDIQRISHSNEVLALASRLTELQNASLADAPHYRPVAEEDLRRRIASDLRFAQRAILVAYDSDQPVGWCHLEPRGIALTGGDLYPYAGAHSVFEPGLPHVPPGDGYSAAARGLLYAACQIRAQQGAEGLDLYAPADCSAESELRAEGFQPVDAWATYVAALESAGAGRAPLHVSSVRRSDITHLPETLQAAGLLDREFTARDLTELIGGAGSFDPQGLLVAKADGRVVGYAAVMVDQPYADATGRKRAWLGFGPLGLGALPGPEQPERLVTLLSAARISAFCRGATELAFVGNAEGHQPGLWLDRGFGTEVWWRRWRTEL